MAECFIINIVWEEFKQAKFRVEYINLFSDKCVKTNLWIKWVYTAITLVLTIVGLCIDNKNWTLITMLATAVIFTFGDTLMIVPDKLSKVNKVFNFYHSHYVEIESLYNLHTGGHISDKECIEKYKYLKLNEININEIILEIFNKQDKKLTKIATQLTYDYLKNVYGTETDE